MSELGALMGFGSFTERTVKTAQTLLEQKYGLRFAADTIGDRYNTGTATIYFHPEQDQTLHFKVIYDAQEKAITDNYCFTKVLRGLKALLRTACSKAGFAVCSEVTVFGAHSPLTDPETDFAAYLKAAQPDKLIFLFAVNADGIQSEQDAQRLTDVLTAFQQQTAPSSKLVFSAHMIPAERFEACRSEFENGVMQSVTRIGFYQPVCSFGINVENGVCSLSAAELYAGCKGA